ncbi:MAG: CdaR family transcriptional regulator [Peptostreptococcaceae bacterium]
MILKQEEISNNLAQEIVDAVKVIVGKNINFIDTKGIIIASTDKTRIGSFNGAGYNAVTSGEVTVVDTEDKYEKSRLGISYPILVKNKPVGAIGITGDPDEVYKFGFMITKITEIFITENNINNRYKSKENLKDYIIKNIIYKQEIEKDIRGYLMDFDIYINDDLSIILINIDELPDTSINLNELENEIINFLDINKIRIYTYMYPNKFIGILTKDVYKRIEKQYLEYFKNSNITCGVGKLTRVANLSKSYEQAKLTLDYSKKHNKKITLANDVSLEIMISSINEQEKIEYINDNLYKLDKEEIELLNIYYENNMSLKLTSECLYIHKNTLQYRLERIKEKTGLNPRNFKDSAKLYMAMLLKAIM